MVNERFSILPLPEFEGNLAQNHWESLDFKGSLGVIVYPAEGTLKSIHVWVMSGSWTKQYNFEYVPEVERSLGFWENDKVFLESSDHELVLFDPSTRELQNLGIDAYPKQMQIIVYVETLVPLNGRSELEELIMCWLPSWRPISRKLGTLLSIFVVSVAVLSQVRVGVEAARVLPEDFAAVNHLDTVYHKAKFSMSYWLQRLASEHSPQGPGH
ncbi:hypothetical protein GQ457_14G001170 [Hibiscus cannabinus]